MNKPQIPSPHRISIIEVLSPLGCLALCNIKSSVLHGDLGATVQTSAQVALGASGKGNRKSVKTTGKQTKKET